MEAKELRIGNFVETNFYKGKITAWNNDKCVIKHKGGIEKCEIVNLKPIPLTEEWLLKFGFLSSTYPGLHWFKYCQISDNKISISEHKSWHSNKHLSFMFNCGGQNNYSSVDIEIKYVHQLQNLYFALTGEELTLNETK